MVPSDITLAPGGVTDLTLVIAELMENATMFSPPTTRVVVTAEHTQHGVRLSIVDQGIGMTEARIAEENSRLTKRERLDLAPTQVLGLFVVGRLARRHRMAVALVPTPGGGITATLYLGEHLLVCEAKPLVPGGDSHLPGVRPQLPVGVVLGALRRADELLAGAPPWNAFAVQRPPQDDPAEPAAPEPAAPGAAGPEPAGPEPAGPEPAGSGAAEPEPDPVSASPVAARLSASGLRQRIPGANHPVGPPVVVTIAKPPTESDAEAVRDLIDQFELGVAQAINDFGTSQ